MEEQTEITLQEEQQVLESDVVTALIAETNATGYEVAGYSFNAENDAFDIDLTGETRSDNCYSGHKIKVKVARSSEGLKILEAEIDRGQEPEIDF